MSRVESYKPYAISDQRYYDRIELSDSGDDLYWQLHGALSEQASISQMGIWARCLRTSLLDLPPHGWKLHVSAVPSELNAVLAELIEEFQAEPFDFKCVRSTQLARCQLARWWPRGGAGKAITIYPADSDDARAVAERLTKRLARFSGPHILTDRRFPGSQNVQYRYGTFRRSPGVDADGHQRSVVYGPDGTPWADDRSPKFTMPPWIDQDPFWNEDLAESPPNDFFDRYRVTGTLRHSTAGGVYSAVDADDRQVILKEARPNTAFAPDGSDAVARLHREHAFLQSLAGTDLAPEALEISQVWEHTFLVQSLVPGLTLQVWLSREHPYAQGLTGADHEATYRARVANLVRQLRDALQVINDQGIVYTDVSLTNILVDATDTLRLVDFESGRLHGQDPANFQRTSGFAPDPASELWQSEKAQLDFAVAAVEAACIVPRNHLLGLDAQVFGQSLRYVANMLDWPINDVAAVLESGVPGVSQGVARGPAEQLPELIEKICRHIRSSATPARTDRLFPSGPELFTTNPLSIAYGAAGVLRALRCLDGGLDPQHLAWLHSRVAELSELPPGLYYGRAGIGLAMLELGDQRGLVQLESAATAAFQADIPADVATGLAGIGLSMLAAAELTGDGSWLDRAEHLAQRLLERAEDDGFGLWWPRSGSANRSLGYLHGSSGIGTYFAELAERTGDNRFLKVARRAIVFDLSKGRQPQSGGLGFGPYDGARAFEPYYIRGGAGVGMALTRMLAISRDAELEAALEAVITAVAVPFTVNPGLFSGMTGLLEFLLDCREVLPGNAQLEPAISRLLGGVISLRSYDGDNGLAFPGDGLMRLSCDHASGSAGIALLLKRIADGSATFDVRYGRPLVGSDLFQGSRP